MSIKIPFNLHNMNKKIEVRKWGYLILTTNGEKQNNKITSQTWNHKGSVPIATAEVLPFIPIMNLHTLIHMNVPAVKEAVYTQNGSNLDKQETLKDSEVSIPHCLFY
jgi:hypothetical protein